MNEVSIRTWLKVAKKIYVVTINVNNKKYSRIQSPNTSNILHLKHHQSRLYQINQLTQPTPPIYKTNPLLPRPLLKRQSQFWTKNTCTIDRIHSDTSFAKNDESTREAGEPSRGKSNQESESFIRNALQLKSPKCRTGNIDKERTGSKSLSWNNPLLDESSKDKEQELDSNNMCTIERGHIINPQPIITDSVREINANTRETKNKRANRDFNALPNYN